MLSIKEFEILISNPESSILDFKSSMYDLTNDKELINTAKLVKDIISFSNTIRNETSYIIIGVEEKDDGTKNLCGIKEVIDDSQIQDKVKDKVFPRPNFLFHTLTYNENLFGVLEFPITKYASPISPVVKMKGLEIGKFYYRSGTTNTEAIGNENIRIANWLQSLPETKVGVSLLEEISDLIKRLTKGEEKLSVIISDMLKIAKLNNLKELIDFCTIQICGKERVENYINFNEFKYRIQTVKISFHKAELNSNSSFKLTESIIKSEMEKMGNFHDYKLFFDEPINNIEEFINNISQNPNSFGKMIKMSSRQIFPDDKIKDYPVYIYILNDTYLNLYRSIRQKTIDILMKM